MYENLLAIKSIMSENASIYVHLDYHIGHYVKILMDEIFGESNFRNEIIWHYTNKMSGSSNPKDFVCEHDTIFRYSKSTDYFYNIVKEERDAPVLQSKRVKVDGKNMRARDENGNIIYEESVEKKVKDVWTIPYISSTDSQRVGYSTQKPEALLERIIMASSNEGMTVADFFCGSGVTATVANKLGRKFITCDIGLNSIETARDRLKNNRAKFDVLEVKDGVSLYRNPTQTMDNIKRVIKGLRNEDGLDKMWEGSINDSKYGLVPVYIPNLTDATTRILNKHLMRRIIHEAMPDLPENIKKVKVFYIDVEDLEEIKKFTASENYFPIEIEFQDLKPLLDNFIMADDARWTMEEVNEGVFSVWQVTIDSFHCDRVLKKIDEYNLKTQEQMAQATEDEKKKKTFTPMTISDEGLECIEWISLDCTSAEEQDEWHSDVELKIEADSRVRYNNGEKSQNYWDGTVRTLDERKPLRMKIRNICGDETIYLL
jgi:adenine-specific DNA-methyltransferase